MSSPLVRFGVVCGVVMGLSVGVPGAVEAFTGETTVTSLVIGLGVALGPLVLTAFHVWQSEACGRFGEVAYAVNMIGLTLFAGIAFALNLVVFFLDDAVTRELLLGPTKVVLLGGTAVFVVGTVVFSVAMLRAGVFPRVPAAGYGVALTGLAVGASLPDGVLTSLLHVLVAVTLVWLSLSMRGSVRRYAERP